MSVSGGRLTAVTRNRIKPGLGKLCEDDVASATPLHAERSQQVDDVVVPFDA